MSAPRTRVLAQSPYNTAGSHPGSFVFLWFFRNTNASGHKMNTQKRSQANTPKPKAAAGRRYLLLGALALAAFGITFVVTQLVKGTSAEMVWIPGGEFTMGTDSDLGWTDEKPAHRVRVNGFWMDETEVTNRQFRQVVEATGYITTAEKPPDVNEILRQSPPGTTAPRNEKLDPV